MGSRRIWTCLMSRMGSSRISGCIQPGSARGHRTRHPCRPAPRRPSPASLVAAKVGDRLAALALEHRDVVGLGRVLLLLKAACARASGQRACGGLGRRHPSALPGWRAGAPSPLARRPPSVLAPLQAHQVCPHQACPLCTLAPPCTHAPRYTWRPSAFTQMWACARVEGRGQAGRRALGPCHYAPSPSARPPPPLLCPRPAQSPSRLPAFHPPRSAPSAGAW